jgi:inorganic pyrophosphatase
MSLLTVPIGKHAPREVHAIIEIPKGSSNKYEYDLTLDQFVLDRVLFSPLYYPFDYGFIAGTLSGDGDPLDVLVLGSQPTFTGCVVMAKPLGGLQMRDEEGEDFKILAVSARDPRFNDWTDLSHIPEHYLREITHFFAVYKELEEKETEVLGWHDRDASHRIILEAHRRLAGSDPSTRTRAADHP